MTQDESRMSQNEGERRGAEGVVCIFSIEDMRRLGSAVGQWGLPLWLVTKKSE